MKAYVFNGDIYIIKDGVVWTSLFNSVVISTCFPTEQSLIDRGAVEVKDCDWIFRNFEHRRSQC